MRADETDMLPKSVGQSEKLPEVPGSYLKESQEERNTSFKVLLVQFFIPSIFFRTLQ